MPAGTLTLTTNSAVVKGAGTAFNTELKSGDFIVSVVGGVTYTLPVKTVDSANQVTLIKAYDGPTQAGAAWYAVPREMQNSITAQLVSEATKAMRGMNYDKQNWQQFFTADGDVTITLPDTSQSTGPSAKKLINISDGKADKVNGAVPINQGGTGSTTARNLFTTSINSGQNWQYPGVTTFDNNLWGSPDKWGFVFTMSNGDTSGNGADGRWYGYLQITTSGLLRVAANINNKFVGAYDVWSTQNTTVDGNGFIKKASPIARLSGAPDKMSNDYLDGFTLAGNVAVNVEARGVTAERVSVGVYKVTGSLGFAKEGWNIEVPQDVNGNRLCFVETSVDKDGTVTVMVSKRRFDVETAMIVAGVPIDIPDGRWIDLRLEMPKV